jgi:hypothetical protein
MKYSAHFEALSAIAVPSSTHCVPPQRMTSASASHPGRAVSDDESSAHAVAPTTSANIRPTRHGSERNGAS